MPDLVEQMYCSQQIFIPPNLPSILKKYAKAAIRTQPSDLLTWSSAYFRALADGIPPPAKDRIEYPPFDSPSGLTPGFLKVLVNQIGMAEVVSKDVLAERWKGVCLNLKALQDLLDVGMFEDEVHWLEFFAICVGTLEPSLTRTMIHICELLTDEPEGGRAAIPVSLFINMYKYLARLDCGPVNNLEQYELMKKADSEATCDAISAPHEEEANSEVPNIDWDTAIEALKERDSEKTVDTHLSDDGMMVWPDIKLQEEGNTSEEPIIEKELLSADGIEVFTDVEPQMTQDNIVVTQELSPNHAPPEVSDQEDNIFAPHIDSITGLLEAESAPLEEISSEEFAAVVKECASEEDVLLTTNVIDPGKDTSDMEGTPQASEDITQSREQTVTSPQKLEKPSARREIDIQSLVKKDSEIMLLPTPVTSDVMLYMENTCNRNGFKISPTQQLTNKMSMVDVQVAVPMDETIEEVYEQHKYPKWMHIPGIGPIVPDHIIEEAEKYFLSVSELQEGMIMPRNIRHFHCPPLELLPDCPDKTL